jgi:hypothetical protein
LFCIEGVSRAIDKSTGRSFYRVESNVDAKTFAECVLPDSEAGTVTGGEGARVVVADGDSEAQQNS